MRELLGRGHSVRVFTRKPWSPDATPLAEHGVTVVKGDYEEDASLERAARGVENLRDVDAVRARGQNGTREEINILRAAQAVGVEHLFYTSVAGAHRATAGDSTPNRGGGSFVTELRIGCVFDDDL